MLGLLYKEFIACKRAIIFPFAIYLFFLVTMLILPICFPSESSELFIPDMISVATSVMLFMILTVSLGMYHATVARTILQNAKDNAEYLSGADVVMKEVWTDNSAFAKVGMDVEFQYYEPDYSSFLCVLWSVCDVFVVANDLTDCGRIPF